MGSFGGSRRTIRIPSCISVDGPSNHGNQLSIYLWGTASSGEGRWSQVALLNPLTEYQRQLPMLRSEFGNGIDLRDAHIDAVVLNAYAGPGAMKIQIDDLSLENMVDLPQSSSPPSDLSLMPGAPETGQSVQVELSQRMHDLRRDVPKWLQYQGESLSWLKTIGINGLVLDAPKDASWLAEARTLGFQILSPPPAATPPVEEWPAFDAVHGWLLGSALDSSHVDASRNLSHRLTQFPTRLLRPTIAEAMEDHWGYSRIADILAVPAPLSTTVKSGKELTELLRDSYEISRGRTLPITSIALQPSREWVDQQTGLINVLGTPQSSMPEFDLLQARLRIYQSIAAGARGWYFRSATPLDSGEEADVLRANALRTISAEIQWLSPWLQASANPTPLPWSNSSYQASVLSTPNADLILLIASGTNDTQCAVPPNGQPIEIPLSSYPAGSQAYRISQGRLEPVQSQQGPNQAAARIDRPGFLEMIVITQDPRVTSFLQQRSRQSAQAIWDIQNDIANQRLKLVQLSAVAEQLSPNNAETWGRIRDAETLSRRSVYLIQRNQVAEAIEAAEQSTILCQRLIRASWERALQQLGSPQSSPWVESELGLPMHWQLSQFVGDRPWQPLPIPGQQALQWEEQMSMGWSVDRRLETMVDSQVRVLPNSGADGGTALHLSAQSIQGEPIAGGFAGSSMRVTSATIQAPARSLVRIEGLVRRIHSGPGKQVGLLVYDDVVGPGSGQLFDSTAPSTDLWQRISLYRLVTGNEGLRIMMEVRGEGEYLVDDLRVSMILPGPAPQFPVSPYDEASSSFVLEVVAL